MSLEKYQELIDIITKDNTDEWKKEGNLSYNDAIYKPYENSNYTGKKEKELITGLSEEIVYKLDKVLSDEEMFIVLERDVYVNIDMSKRKKYQVTKTPFEEIGKMLKVQKNKQKVWRIYTKAKDKLKKSFSIYDFQKDYTDYSCYHRYTGTKTGSIVTDFYTQTPCQLKKYLDKRFGDTKTACPGIYSNNRFWPNQLTCGKLFCNKFIPAGLRVKDCAKKYKIGESTVAKYFESGIIPGKLIETGKSKPVWVTTGEPITQCNENVFDTRVHKFDKHKHLWWKIDNMKNKILTAKSQNYQHKENIGETIRLKKKLLQKMQNILDAVVEKSFDKAI